MLERFRSNKREMVRQYVGARYSEDGAPNAVPVNLLALYISIVGRNLIAKTPRFMLSTFNREARPIVRALETYGNREMERMQAAATMQRVVVDSLFSIGIAKVALATPSDAAQFSWRLTAGEPFLDDVDLDDFVFDAHARNFDEVSFIGHRYRVPLDTVRDSKLYTKARKELTESRDEPYNLEGDERISRIGMGYWEMQTEEFEPHVDLWEVYLPRHRAVITLADEWLSGGPAADGDEGLRMQRYIGPETGPYAIQCMMNVPGNIMPKAPLQDLVDLHESTNRSFRKVMRTVDRIKEWTAVQGGATEDGERAMSVNDGEIVSVDNPANVHTIVSGGQAVQQVLAIATVFRDLFSYQGGNLEVAGGLSPQAKTAHQEQILNQNAGGGIQDMQDKTVTFVSSVISKLAWYWHHHPASTYTAPYSVRGLKSIQHIRSITPDQRQAVPFSEIALEVDPYSLAHKTPQSRLKAINEVIQTIYLPLAQIAQQQGVSLDLNAYFEKAAQYMDEPDIDEILTIRRPPPQNGGSPGGSSEGPGMPAQTERTYTRQNMPGSTRQASDRNLVTSLLGIDTGGTPSANGKAVATP